MYAITGATGNTGSEVVHKLLNNSKRIRVIGRNAEHLHHFVARGAEAVIADLTDTAKLVQAFTGTEAVYAMIPPNPAAPDVLAYDDRITASLASALVAAHVPYVVSLSSVGADKPEGTGPVMGLRRLEQALDGIDGLNALQLRAGYFMENTLAQAVAIQATGAMAGPIRADLKLPMIAARDIGGAAAEALLQLGFKGHQTRELLGQRDISYAEVSSIIGRAIGQPALKYTQLPPEQMRPILAQMGMSPNFIDRLLEMCAALNSESMKPLERRSPQNTTPTSYESFVGEKFMPAYQKLSKAA
jgi:uncharacterized protein YbjT (DUF2867 family)